MNSKKFLGVELPVIQAPMAGVQDHALAVAVSMAGGLGSLACAMLSAEALQEQASSFRAETSGPLNTNFFCHTQADFNSAREQKWRRELGPYFAEFGIEAGSIPDGVSRQSFSHEHADILDVIRPEVVSFHFGLPEKSLLQRVKSLGAVVLSSATTVKEAQWLESHGADGIIAQGLEAGGHRGMFLTDDITSQMGTFSLLPQILNTVGVPVIAAGGIATPKGVAAALSLGAVAVQVGTAYLLCNETRTSAIHRAAIQSEFSSHTALTNLFSGRPARSIVNRVISEIGPMSSNTPAFPLAGAAISAIRSRAEAKGLGDFSPLWCGQNASTCAEISAQEMTKALASLVN
jgi:nitronate monooxygenase